MKIHSDKLRRLYDDWDRRRNGRAYPARADFDPADLLYCLGDIFLVDVIRGPSRLEFRYRLYGTHLVDRLGLELTRKFVDDIPIAERRQNARAHLEEVIAIGAPVAYLRNHWFKEHNAARDCEVLVLPLSSNRISIDMLLCAFGWDI